MTGRTAIASVLASLLGLLGTSGAMADPDLIFQESTKFRLLTPSDKLATFAIDDPAIEGVACYYTVPEKGGRNGACVRWAAVAAIARAARPSGPIKFKEKVAQGDTVFSERRSIFFKHMQIVRGCDGKRNVLVYMVYSDKLIEGSPKNSTSSVPVMPWGQSTDTPRCNDFVKN